MPLTVNSLMRCGPGNFMLKAEPLCEGVLLKGTRLWESKGSLDSIWTQKVQELILRRRTLRGVAADS